MLIISVFVLVVMAVLAIAMNRMLSSSSDTLVHEVFGLRALQAARSGLETKLTQIFPLGGATDSSSCDIYDIDGNLQTDRPVVTQPLTGDGLAFCQYQHQCSRFTYHVDEDDMAGDPDDLTYFRLSSTGICQVDDRVVSRTLSVDARVGN